MPLQVQWLPRAEEVQPPSPGGESSAWNVALYYEPHTQSMGAKEATITESPAAVFESPRPWTNLDSAQVFSGALLLSLSSTAPPLINSHTGTAWFSIPLNSMQNRVETLRDLRLPLGRVASLKGGRLCIQMGPCLNLQWLLRNTKY